MFAPAPSKVWTVSQTPHCAAGLTYLSEKPPVCFELMRGHCLTGVWLKKTSSAEVYVQIGVLRAGLRVKAL